jgi:branched-subunit amino acid transport protein
MGNATGWITVLAIGAASIAIKATGPLVMGGRTMPRRLTGVVGLLAPALLAALVATTTFATGQALVLDARIAGVVVAALAIALRAPTLVVVVLAAAAGAAARLLGMS